MAEKSQKRERLIGRRKALGLSQQDVADALGIKNVRNYQRWESGDTTPSIRFRASLAEAMRVDLEALSDLLDHSDTKTESLLVGSTSIPSRAGRAEIEQIRLASTHLNQLYFRFGGSALVRATAQSQLKWAHSLLKASCANSLRKELFGAVARMSMRVGAIAWDAHDHTSARHALMFAKKTAEEVDDWHLRASVFSYLARQSVWIGRPEDGLTYAEQGLVRSDRISTTERAMLQVARARALARTHQIGRTQAAIAAADEAFHHHSKTEDPPWMAYYDDAQLSGDTGHALYDLAIRGDSAMARESVERLRRAVANHTDAYTRSRAFSLSKLASLLIELGDIDEGSALGRQAVSEFASVTSMRAVTYLQELAKTVAPHRSANSNAKALSYDVCRALAPEAAA